MKTEALLLFRNQKSVYLLGIVLVLASFSLVSCNGKVNTVMSNPPISTGTMPIVKGGPIYELSVEEVTEQIKNEAYSLSIDEIRELPYGKEIVTKEGILKRRVFLGNVVRVYSLNDNNVSLSDFETPPPRNNAERVLSLNSMIRDFSDKYIATVNVAGLGAIGYVTVPVYSVYKGWHEINEINYQELRLINDNNVSLLNKVSKIGIGELNSQILEKILPNASVDNYLYYFTNNEGREVLVRVIHYGTNTFLFSEIDGSWYSVDSLGKELTTQENDKFRFVMGNDYVKIRKIAALQ